MIGERERRALIALATGEPISAYGVGVAVINGPVSDRSPRAISSAGQNALRPLIGKGLAARIFNKGLNCHDYMITPAGQRVIEGARR